jgi:hypothetical protein
MAAHFSEVGYDGISALSHPWKGSYPSPFLKDVLIGVPKYAKSVFVRLETDGVASFDTQKFADLYRNGNLTLAGDLGAERRRGY